MVFKFKEFLPAIFILAVFAAVIYYMMFKRKPAETVSETEPEVPPVTEKPGAQTESSGKGAGGTAVPKP